MTAADLRMALHRDLIAHLDARNGNGGLAETEDQMRERAERFLRSRLATQPSPEREALAASLLDEIFAFGPITPFLEDPEVTEIMVNGHRTIYVEREGRLVLTEAVFTTEESLRAAIDRIVARVDRRLDASSPFVDARLPDGSRVNAIIPPLSLSGPCLTIRKFRNRPFSAEELVRLGTLSAEAADYLREAVTRRKNIIVSGGTGSGKTTLLNVLSGFIPDGERIITIEDAAELRLAKPHVVRLEARPANLEGAGAVTIRDLVRNSLRMRPDRIVVGECRGGEALDMLQAMNTGHDGSLTTGHANSPRDMLRRLETMVLMSGIDLHVRAIREQVASAIDLVVHVCRLPSGARVVTSITEIAGMSDSQILLQETFRREGGTRSERAPLTRTDVPSRITADGSLPW